MATKRDPKRRPTHPGAILREDVLPSLGLTQTECAHRLGMSRLTGFRTGRRSRSNRADRCLIVGKAYESIRAGLLSALADTTARSSRPHSEAVIELVRNDPAFADEYLRAAKAQSDQEGGRHRRHPGENPARIETRRPTPARGEENESCACPLALCNVTLYTRPVIKTFRHKGLQTFFETGSKAGIQPHHAPRLKRQLTRLDLAASADDMNLPGWKLHPLSNGHWSVWVNGNWRVTFTFEGTDAVLVDYQDYH